MEKTLFSYIWKYSRLQQLTLLALTLITFPILYATLELPKLIINDAIGATDETVVVQGYEVTQITYLMILCSGFLLAVIVWGLVKMRLNTMKGIMAERLLRRFRYQLMSRVMRFPLPHFRRTSQGAMVAIVTSEAEPLGGIMGDAVAQPVFQAGQMITILSFLFVQSVWLGLTAVALIPLQAWIIPKLQRQVNLLNKARVKEVRRLAEDIGEVVAGAEDIRANGATPYMLALFTQGLGRLFDIRYQIYQKKFFMKFVNNFISQMTPFFFFSIGGYLVIEDLLTIGALVAALAAFKDLSSPWKELLAYYNQSQDMSLRYDTIIEQFDPPGLIDAKLIEGRPEAFPRLNGAITFDKVTVREPDGGRVLDDLSLTIPAGAHVAIQFANASERQALSQALSRSVMPTSGKISIGEHDLSSLHQGVISARIGVASKPFLFKGRIEDNTRLALRTVPLAPEGASAEVKAALKEAKLVGNSAEPTDTPWLDLKTPGFENVAAVRDWWARITEALGTDAFLLKRGLEVTFDPAQRPKLAKRLVAIRSEAARRIKAADLESAFYPFDKDTFNDGQAIGGNILYAISRRKLNPEDLAADPDFKAFITDAGATKDAEALGAGLLSVITLTFGEVGADHPLFRRLGLEADLFEWLSRVDERREAGGTESLCELDRQLLWALPFCFTAEQFGTAFSDELKQRIMDVRKSRSEGLTGWAERNFSPIDPDQFIVGLPVLENIIFGRISRNAGAKIDKLQALIGELLEEEGLRTPVAGLIGDVPVVSGGADLSTATHERISVIRAALRRPDVLVLDQALQSQDSTTRFAFRERVRTLLPEATIIYLGQRVEQPEDFDQFFEISQGRLSTDVSSGLDDKELQSDLALKIQALGTTSLFAGLSRSQVRLLAFASQWFEAKAGDYVFRQGEEADAAYLITNGIGELLWNEEKSAPFEGNIVEAGRLIGDLSVIRREQRPLNLIVHEDITGLRIGAAELLEVIESDPDIAMNLLRTVSGYLVGIAGRVREQSGDA